MKTYKEQIEEYHNLNKYAEKEALLRKEEEQYSVIEAKICYSLEKLKAIKNDLENLVSIETQQEIDHLLEAVKNRYSKFNTDPARQYYLDQKLELDEYTQGEYQKHKKGVIIHLDPGCCKELNLPCLLYFEGGKEKQQAFYNEFFENFNEYCFKKLGVYSKRCGYSYLYTTRHLDELRVAESAEEVNRYIIGELAK